MNQNARNILLTILLVCVAATLSAQDSLFSPLTYQSQVTDTFFGTPVPDPYRWLEDINSAPVKQWLKEQRKITLAESAKFAMKHLNISELFDVGYRVGIHHVYKEGAYYFKFMSTGSDSPAQLMYATDSTSDYKLAYDANTGFKPATYSIRNFKLAADSAHLAVMLSAGGSDWCEIRVRNLATQTYLPDVIKWVKFSNMAWYGNGFFYSRYNNVAENELHLAANTGQQLCYHTIGTPQAQDAVVHTIADNANAVFGFSLSHDNRYLLFYTVAKLKGVWCNVVTYMDLSGGLYAEQKLLLASPVTLNVDYEVVDMVDNYFIVKTDYNAPNGCLIKVHKDSFNNAGIIIPQYREVLMDVEHINKKYLCLYNNNGIYRAAAFSYEGKVLSTLTFDTGSVIADIQGKPDDSVAYFTQSGFYYPEVICTLNLHTNTAAPVQRSPVMFNARDFITRLVTYPSHDGTMVPMYITYRKTTNMAKPNPVLLYGYGGFGISLTPHYDFGKLLFCASGGVLAVPLIRGGGERGKLWHEMGRGLNKQNSFDDFAAAAQYLIDNNYTTSSKLAIHGASHGGLLVGAMLTRCPHLFKAAVASVGVFDMLRYHRFTGARFLIDEFGSVEDSVQFGNLYSYSPYHNLKPRADYPATLIITAENDDRVPPLHAYKFLARLQQVSQSKQPHILYFEKDSGHSGGITFDDRVEQRSFMWAFIFRQLGLTIVSDF